MKTEPKTLPGFMELMPDEQILFNNLMNIIKDSFEMYSFAPLDTPVIEYAEVLLAKAGGETEKQIYRFMKGDNDLALRFDLTVPLAKYVAKRYNDLVFPFKRYQIGKVFRGERQQKGRYREFYQCDIDVIGDETLSLSYDSEIPAVIYDVFRKMNIGKFIIRINNRKILNGFFEYLGLTNKISDILRIVDKIDKIGVPLVLEELRLLDIEQDNINKIIDFINIEGSNKEKLTKFKSLNIDDDLFNQGVNELETVFSNLLKMQLDETYFMIDLKIARGLDYYTGTVYETNLVAYPEIGSICSGGRYDNLAQYYTDKQLPGVGISIGFTRLFYLLRELNIIIPDKKNNADLVIVPLTEDLGYIYNVANTLRNNNKVVDIVYIDKGIKQKMKYVDKIKTRMAILIGDNEINNNTVIIKDMTTGNQEEVLTKDLINKI